LAVIPLLLLILTDCTASLLLLLLLLLLLVPLLVVQASPDSPLPHMAPNAAVLQFEHEPQAHDQTLGRQEVLQQHRHQQHDTHAVSSHATLRTTTNRYLVGFSVGFCVGLMLLLLLLLLLCKPGG
jgi:hypothetical protein